MSFGVSAINKKKKKLEQNNEFENNLFCFYVVIQRGIILYKINIYISNY